MEAVNIRLDFCLNKLHKRVQNVKIDTCLISIRDDMVYSYFRNKKCATKLFKLNSATKSILSILVGMAIDGGAVDGVHVPISQFFSGLSEGKSSITVENLLTMSPGVDWEEFGQWGGRPFPMMTSKNWVKFILDRPMIQPPGERMIYNSGCSHLLSYILKKSTGQHVERYAKEHLFKAIGVSDFDWRTDSSGIAIGGFGLSIRAIDMQKIGRLMLQNGIFADKHVVSATWVQNSTKRRFHTYDNIGSYGYHWWILTDKNDKPFHPYTYFAMGYGGQYIIVTPDIKLVVTFTSDMPNQTFLPLEIFKEEIIEAFVPRRQGQSFELRGR